MYTVSGTISLPSTGFFSFFSRPTCPLSVDKEYLALGGGPPGFTPGFTCLVLLGFYFKRVSPFAYRTFTSFGRSFQIVRLGSTFVTLRVFSTTHLSNPSTPNTQRIEAWHAFGLGSFHFARRYSGSQFLLLFLKILRCFNSLRSLLHPIYSDEDTKPSVW